MTPCKKNCRCKCEKSKAPQYKVQYKCECETEESTKCDGGQLILSATECDDSEQDRLCIAEAEVKKLKKLLRQNSSNTCSDVVTVINGGFACGVSKCKQQKKPRCCQCDECCRKLKSGNQRHIYIYGCPERCRSPPQLPPPTNLWYGNQSRQFYAPSAPEMFLPPPPVRQEPYVPSTYAVSAQQQMPLEQTQYEQQLPMQQPSFIAQVPQPQASYITQIPEQQPSFVAQPPSFMTEDPFAPQASFISPSLTRQPSFAPQSSFARQPSAFRQPSVIPSVFPNVVPSAITSSFVQQPSIYGEPIVFQPSYLSQADAAASALPIYTIPFFTPEEQYSRGPSMIIEPQISRGPSMIQGSQMFRAPSMIAEPQISRGPVMVFQEPPVIAGSQMFHAPSMITAAVSRGPSMISSSPVSRGPSMISSSPISRGPSMISGSPVSRGPSMISGSSISRVPSMVPVKQVSREPSMISGSSANRGPSMVRGLSMVAGMDRGPSKIRRPQMFREALYEPQFSGTQSFVAEPQSFMQQSLYDEVSAMQEPFPMDNTPMDQEPLVSTSQYSYGNPPEIQPPQVNGIPSSLKIALMKPASRIS